MMTTGMMSWGRQWCVWRDEHGHMTVELNSPAGNRTMMAGPSDEVIE
jgi:hypothetical protein